MQARHRYVRIGGQKRLQYFDLQQNPLRLMWLLYRHGKPFGFRGIGIRKALGGLKRLAGLVIRFWCYQVRLANPDGEIDLPMPGHLCLKVRNGYKIFDLRREVVVKIFAQNIDRGEVRREIEWARRAGAHRFAPTVRLWSVEDAWYEEDYVNGYPKAGSNWTLFLPTLHESLIPLLGTMLLATAPRAVMALEYARGLGDLIRDKRGRFSDGQLDATKVATVRSFADALIDGLRLKGDYPIYLVCSHGDFHPGHVLTTAHGPVLIDWEAARHRSASFDLYHAFFRRFRTSGIPSGIMVAIEDAISRLQSHLALHASADLRSMRLSLDATEIYRMIYYIECICLYAQKGPKVTPAHLNKILSFLDVYQRYEEKLLDVIDRSVSP